MDRIADDTRGGFNQFLKEQRDEDGEATVTLYDFNDTVELVYQDRAIDEADKLTGENYKPGGQTALHDAIVRAIDETVDQIETMAPANQPDNVIVVTLTDGKENASETPQDTLRKRVEARQQEDWEFLFIGANQDAALTAEKVGMDADSSLSMSHSGEGAKEAYESASESISRARETGDSGGFTDEDRQRQRDIDDET